MAIRAHEAQIAAPGPAMILPTAVLPDFPQKTTYYSVVALAEEHSARCMKSVFYRELVHTALALELTTSHCA